jgi:hypothetical protein
MLRNIIESLIEDFGLLGRDSALLCVWQLREPVGFFFKTSVHEECICGHSASEYEGNAVCIIRTNSHTLLSCSHSDTIKI